MISCSFAELLAENLIDARRVYIGERSLQEREVPMRGVERNEGDRALEIVEEVKQSEEWEAVKMNILEIGIAKGRDEGMIEGKAEAILDLLDTKGLVSEELRCQIMVQKDAEILRK